MTATFTITGTIVNDDKPTRGVYATLSREVRNPTEDLTYQRQRRVESINGEFTITGNPAWDATNLPYDASAAPFAVEVSFGNHRIVIPAQPAGSTVDIADFPGPWSGPPVPTDSTTVDNLTAPLVGNAATATGAALLNANAAQLAVLTPEMFGWIAVEDGGSALSSTNRDALLAAIAANGGARLLGGKGKTYRCDLKITLPHNGATPPKNYPVVLAGAGMNASGQGTALLGGTVYDLRYAGSNRSSGTNPDGTSVNLNDAKIVTLGLGMLAFEDCTLTDKGTSSAPFVHSTYTTIRTKNFGVIGNPSKATSTCDQDVFVLGGQNAIPGTPTVTDADAPFQGYGTKIEGVFANRIRRLVLGQVYCNAIVVRDNTIWAQSGSGLTNGAAIEFRGDAGSTCSGNVISGNLTEMPGYKCAVGLYYSVHTAVVNNPTFDSVSGRVAGVYCGVGAQYNYIEQGFAEDTYPGLVEDPTVFGSNTFRTSHQSQASIQPQPQRHYAPIMTMKNGGFGPYAIEGRGNIGAVRADPGINPYPITHLSSAPATQVTDGVLNSTRTVTSATAAFTDAKNKGMPIFGTGIPANTFIVSVDSTTQVTLSNAATATSTGVTLSIGNATASFTNELGVSRRHVITQGAIGAGSVNGNAGTGGTPSATATGTDTAFQLTLVTGASGQASGVQCTVAYGIAFAANPKFALTARNAAAAAAIASNQLFITTTGANFSLNAGVALPASTTMIFDVIAIQ